MDTQDFRRLESCWIGDINKQRSVEQEKTYMFLLGPCSYSHLTAEQTMTGWGGLADTSPSMCENKSAQGWRPVCLQQSWKFEWLCHVEGHVPFNKSISLNLLHVMGSSRCFCRFLPCKPVWGLSICLLYINLNVFLQQHNPCTCHQADYYNLPSDKVIL